MVLARSDNSPRLFHTRLMTFVRGLAAFEVFLAHMRNQFFLDSKLVAQPHPLFKLLVLTTGYGEQAVLLFFVISGWLVGGHFLDRYRQPGATTQYAIDRISRIWTVLIPTMLFSLISYTVMTRIWGRLGEFNSESFAAPAFLGNLVGLANLRVPDYGGNLVLWSLSNEIWYYIGWPALLFLFVPKTSIPGRVVALSVLALGWTATKVNWSVVSLAPVWLCPILISHLNVPRGRRLVWALAVVQVPLLLWVRTHLDQKYLSLSYLQGLLFSLTLAAARFECRPLTGWAKRLERAAHRLSEMSFPLYVMHVPLLLMIAVALRAQFGLTKLDGEKGTHVALFGVFVGFVFLGCAVFYRFVEAHTYGVRNFIKGGLSTSTPAKAFGLARRTRESRYQ